MAVSTQNVKNKLAKRASDGGTTSVTINGLLSEDNIKRRFREILGEKAAGFMSSVINVVNGSTNLKQCDPRTVLSAAAVAASLDLPIDPNLGFAYIVPYKGRAQFQLGYKGYVQLAMRSGQYKTMNVAEVYEGELTNYNRITGEIEFDQDKRTSDKVVGYVAFFRLINGFEKYEYMTVEEIEAHARRFSQSYNRPTSPWKTEFHAMAMKTVLKRLLSRYGILSIDMQTAVKADQAVIREGDGGEVDFDYVDAAYAVPEDEDALAADYEVQDAPADDGPTSDAEQQGVSL